MSTRGYDPAKAWKIAYDWAVKPFSFGAVSQWMLNDLLGILSADQQVEIEYDDKGERKTALIQWASKDKYPVVY